MNEIQYCVSVNGLEGSERARHFFSREVPMQGFERAVTMFEAVRRGSFLISSMTKSSCRNLLTGASGFTGENCTSIASGSR